MILVKSVFNEDQNNYYHNVFFLIFLEITKIPYIMIELNFLKKLMLIKQGHQKSVISFK